MCAARYPHNQQCNVTCDGFGAAGAPLAEQLPEAVGAVGLVIPGGEPLA